MKIERVAFQDFHPSWTSEMRPGTCVIPAIDFIFKTAAGMRNRLSWTVSKRQNQSKTTANVTKNRRLKIIKIKRSDDPPKASYSLFTKRYENNENVNKINISSPLRCQNHWYSQGPIAKIQIVSSLDARLWGPAQLRFRPLWGSKIFIL